MRSGSPRPGACGRNAAGGWRKVDPIRSGRSDRLQGRAGYEHQEAISPMGSTAFQLRAAELQIAAPQLARRARLPLETVTAALDGLPVDRAALQAVAAALGLQIALDGSVTEVESSEAFRLRQARRRSAWLTRQVQGTMASEGQVRKEFLDEMTGKGIPGLLANPRYLWVSLAASLHVPSHRRRFSSNGDPRRCPWTMSRHVYALSGQVLLGDLNLKNGLFYREKRERDRERIEEKQVCRPPLTRRNRATLLRRSPPLHLHFCVTAPDKGQNDIKSLFCNGLRCPDRILDRTDISENAGGLMAYDSRG